MSPRITDCFNAALKQLLKSEGRGGQTDLAMRLGVTKPYLNNLLSGRKAQWPDHLKEAAAAVFDRSVAELLILGEAYLTSGIWFPYAHKLLHLAPKSLDRATTIFRAAADDVGLGMTQILFSPATLPSLTPKRLEEYLDGSIDDANFYDHALNFCRRICPNGK